ncbi:hypothetical protein AB0O75_36705 [Streptomyces sp. NPDC088921]
MAEKQADVRRRLARAALFSATRSISAALASAPVALLVWWVQSR